MFSSGGERSRDDDEERTSFRLTVILVCHFVDQTQRGEINSFGVDPVLAMVQTNELFHSIGVNLDETHQRLTGRRLLIGRRHRPMAKMKTSKGVRFDEDGEEMSQIRRMKRFGNGRN